MAGFDYFSQLQGPVVNTSLFSDAATAGIAAGRNLPTKTTATIRGLQEGLDRGIQDINNVQTLAIKQHEIEQFPVTDKIRQEQLQSAEQANEIQALQLQLTKDTQEYAKQVKIAELQQEAALASQKLKDLKIQEQISNTLAGGDPKTVLNNPAYTDFLIRNPKYAEGVIGSLAEKGLLSAEEKKRMYEFVNFSKQQEFERETKLAAAKSLNAVAAEVKNDESLYALIGDVPVEQFSKRVEVYPKGLKQVFEEGENAGHINPDASDNPLALDSPNKEFDIFVDGKKAGVTTDKGASKVRKLINTVKPLVGEDKQSVQEPTQRTATSSKAPSAPNTLPRIAANKQLAQAGISPEQATPVLEIAKRRATEAPVFQRALLNIIPDFLETNLVTDAAVNARDSGADPESLQVNKILDEAASKLTSETLDKLKTADSKTKQQIRDWAEANGLELNAKTLKNYYKQEATKALSSAYNEAYAVGEAEANLSRKQKAAIDSEKVDQRKAIAAKTPLSILNSAQAVPNEVVSGGGGTGGGGGGGAISPPALTPTLISERVNSLGKMFNLSKTELNDIEGRALRIISNKYFKGKPSYVKAVGAVESSGNNNAVSSKGVRGPMQVTQKTAGQYGLNRNIPEENVQAGQLYLEDLIKMFNGSKELAYAAYNTGASVVRYAQRLAKGSSNWKVVKNHIYDALVRYEKALGVDPTVKLGEVYNYPEKVLLHEEVLG